jgi:outer membrane protein TolC
VASHATGLVWISPPVAKIPWPCRVFWSNPTICMVRPRHFPVLLAAVLGGCATYEPGNVVPAATLAQLDARRLDDAGLARFLAAHGLAPGAEWDVARLTLAAFFYNPALSAARARLIEQEAGVRSAEARPNPSLTFTPGRSEATAGGLSPWILGFALDVPVELAGKRTHRAAEARRRAESARLELASVAWSVHATVRGAVIDWQGAEAEAELWRAQLPLLAQAARLMEVQVSAGESSSLAAVQARTVLARAELAARESERSILAARSRLAAALGVPLAAVDGLRVSETAVPAAGVSLAPQEARAWAALNRADLLAALSDYAAAEAALQGEVARQFPDLVIGPGYQLDQGTGKWSLGIGLGLPILNRNEGPIAVAEARRTAAAARFLDVQSRILAEVDRAAADFAAALTERQAARGLKSGLEQQMRLIRVRQEAGEMSRLERVRAESDLAELARTELAAELRARRAQAALEDAVQRPLAWPEAAWRRPDRVTRGE